MTAKNSTAEESQKSDSARYGIVTEPNTIRFERLLPGPIERVWAYITEPEKRAQWFAGGPMELTTGGKIEFLFDHRNLTTEPTPEPYKEHCEGTVSVSHVTTCEPPRRISFTWDEATGGESEVMIELMPRDENILLVLTHRRLCDESALRDVSGGWHIHLDLLEDQLHGRPLRPFWSTIESLNAEYKRRQSAE